ncbi:PAS domain S-box protein [bacterium]|nr:MAG: PAS domain S-box protein [bacterium]
MTQQGQNLDFRHVLAASPALLVVVTPEFRVIEASDAYLSATHRDRTSVIGRSLFEVFPERPGDPDATDQVSIQRSLLTVVRTREPHRIGPLRYDVERANGAFEERYWILKSAPILDAAGEVTAIVHQAEEVTNEVMLERREAAILESITDAFFALDRDWRFTYVNAQAQQILGREAGELDSRIIWDEFPGLLGSEFESMYRLTAADRVPHSLTDFYPDHQRWYEVHAFPGVPDGITVYFRNVTDRVLADQALRSSEERFRKLADRAPVLIWTADAEGKATWFNRPWLQFTGRTMEEELGYGWSQSMHPEDLTLSRQSFAGQPREQDRYALLYRLRRHDGEYRWIREHGVPIFGSDGSFEGYIGSCFDVTDQIQVQAELEARVAERTRELEEAVRESESFNYSIAHDLRAPLRAIASTSRILMDDLGETLSEEHRDWLARQVRNANRLGQLIDELLRLSRLARVDVNREAIDLTEKVRSVVGEIGGGRKVEIQEGMIANCDRALVRTVIENLVGNALKFSPTDSTVRVGETNGVFWVRDEGVGFDMQYAPKLFLPFERLVTEAQFPGTGIGLANVERIIRRHGGRIWAESEPGKGATFYFTLGPG